MSPSPTSSSGGRFRFRDLIPFGPRRHPRPRPFLEMLGAGWENRDQLGYAMRILNHGVCDGCSLGPRGLRDDVIDGLHLCTTRLKLLRLNTVGPIPDDKLTDLDALRSMSNEQLQSLGRIPYPLVHRAGGNVLHRLSWDEAMAIAREELDGVTSERMGFFATSRGLVNETYYAFQKAARLIGSNHVDSSGRACHAASATGLEHTLGFPSATCSLKDMIGSDLVVIMGSHLANNQPVAMKYLIHAKRQGTRILVVNPMREPGLERYWVPSDARSALFGTRLMDDFFQVAVGGDMAFMHGVLKLLIEREWLDRTFITQHTRDFETVRDRVGDLSWREIERASGLGQADILRFAEHYAKAKTCVFIYSTGLTQHRFGVENTKALVNLALARGMLGREKCGIMPMGGHSGVQGARECGVDPDRYPGGFDVANDAHRQRFETLWGASLPKWKGHRTLHMLEAAQRGEIDLLYSLGGNLLETMPDRDFMMQALERPRLRVQQDIVLDTSSLLSGKTVLILPAQTRYETPGGGTTTSTERRIRFTPEIAGPRIAEALPEWTIPVRFAAAIRPATAAHLNWKGTADIRAEIAKAMPLYTGIERLEREGQWVQWGGERLYTDGFTDMPDRRARFSAVEIPSIEIPDGYWHLTTRRGKQFNSMTHGDRDPLLGSRTRYDVLINANDASALGVQDGQELLLRSDVGEWSGTARIGPMKERHLQAYWPECNVLIPRRCDPVSGEPDYNTMVTAEPRGPVPGMTPARIERRPLRVVGEAQPEPMGSQRVRESVGGPDPVVAG